MNSQRKVCDKGHVFYKSSDCNACPQCAALDKPTKGFLALLPSPARRALFNHGIDSIEKLATYARADILSLHGIGPRSMPILEECLKAAGLQWKNSLKA